MKLINNAVIPTRLSKSEFSAAIRRGHGRALLHVNQYGLDEFADIVLHACLKEPSYDRQCESSRAQWLFSMFTGTKEYAWLASEIVSALDTETEQFDLSHFYELLAQMAKNGDKSAGAALRFKVLSQTFALSEYQLGCNEFVSVDGVDAVVELARRYGAELSENPEDNWQVLDDLTYGLDILPQVETKLQELALTDDAIKRFWNNEKLHKARLAQSPKLSEAERTDSIRERIRRELPTEKVLSNASAHAGQYPGNYMRFGQHATEAELLTIFQQLLIETDEKIYLRLLWVFRKARLPELHPRIWALASSKNNDVRAAAQAALAQFCDPKVGEFARNKLRALDFSESDTELLELFILNYQSTDENLIIPALTGLPEGDEHAHHFGMSILAIGKNNYSPALSAMFEWVYEKNPCTICRQRAVEWLIKTKTITLEIAHECRYDANEDIQNLVKQLVPIPQSK
jgi:hypothetical protein